MNNFLFSFLLKTFSSLFAFVVVFSLSTNQLNSQSDLYAEKELVFPNLDQQLIKLWIATHDMDSKSASESIIEIQKEWPIVRSELNAMHLEHINMKDFVKGVSAYIEMLSPYYDNNDFSGLQSISYHILYEFRSLRQCLFKTEYSMDLLWEIMDDYIQIKKTINDRMFNLKEWFEFEDDINAFICHWEYYDLRTIGEIQAFFPGIKKLPHSQLKEKVGGCLNDLLKSIESGFQSNFILPCDDLGDALEDLMRYYSDSSMKLLM